MRHFNPYDITSTIALLHSHRTNTSKVTALCLQVFVAAHISANAVLRVKEIYS